MAGARAEHVEHALDVGAGERGEVDGGIEAAAREQPGEVGRGAVSAEALDPVPERILEGAAVEQRHPVSAGEQPPGEQLTHEPVSTDDEHVHGPQQARTGRRREAPSFPFASNRTSKR